MAKHYWNYRITTTESYGETVYNIREVYFDDEKITGWTKEPQYPQGETLDELRNDMEYMKEALEKPVLRIIDDNTMEEVSS